MKYLRNQTWVFALILSSLSMAHSNHLHAGTKNHGMPLDTETTTGGKYAASIVDLKVDEIRCPQNHEGCKISAIEEFMDFKFMVIQISEITEKGKHQHTVLAVLDGSRISEAESYSTFSGTDFRKHGISLHWKHFNSRDEFEAAYLDLIDISSTTRQDAEDLLIGSGLVFHRTKKSEGQEAIQYFRPLFAKGSLLQRAGSNYSPNIPWIAELTVRGDRVLGFITTSTGMGDEQLLRRQVQDHWDAGREADGKRSPE